MRKLPWELSCVFMVRIFVDVEVYKYYPPRLHSLNFLYSFTVHNGFIMLLCTVNIFSTNHPKSPILKTFFFFFFLRGVELTWMNTNYPVIFPSFALMVNSQVM